jgi:DNA integrity scanning protein DisA with diadenylate cyclase activity
MYSIFSQQVTDAINVDNKADLMFSPEKMLEFIKVDSAAVLDNTVNKEDSKRAENSVMPNSTRVCIRIGNNIKFQVKLEGLINN